MMYGYDVAGFGGWWMFAGIGILALIVLGSGWLIVHRPGSARISLTAPDEILRQRFARGELTVEQFEEAKARLG